MREGKHGQRRVTAPPWVAVRFACLGLRAATRCSVGAIPPAETQAGVVIGVKVGGIRKIYAFRKVDPTRKVDANALGFAG